MNVQNCVVVQKKQLEKSKYYAVQLGVGDKSPHKVSRALKKHFEKANVKPTQWLREFKVSDLEKYELGKPVPLDFLKPGDTVDVRGTTKGHGFSGVVKRWSFQGGPAAHGSRFHRRIGSIGNRTFPKKVFKGKHMPGRYGNEPCMVLNVVCLDVMPTENMLVLKGSLPGPTHGLLEIRKSNRG